MENKHPIASQRKRYQNYIINRYFYSFFRIFLFILAIIFLKKMGKDFFDPFMITSVVLFLITNFIILPTLTGKTLAMFITKTRIVTKDGKKPTLKHILMSELSQFLIPFETLSLFFGRHPKMLHDRISKTRVIYEGDEKELAQEGTSAIYPELSKPKDRKRFFTLLLILAGAIIFYLFVAIKTQ